MHVILEYRDPDRPRKAHIVAIHDAAELAQKLVSDDESDRKLETLEWPNQKPPEVGAAVTVAERQIESERPGGLLSLLEATLNRQEDKQLREKNEALSRLNSQLQSKLQANSQTRHVRLNRDTKHRQVRDLWVSATVQGARESIVADYARLEFPMVGSRIMITPDSDTVAHFNRLAQENRGHEVWDPTRAIAHNNILLYVGDRVQFNRTDEELGVRGDDLGEVVGLFPGQRTVAVALDRSEMKASDLVFVSLREYDELDLGYATTYDRAGDIDIYEALVLATRGSRPLVDSLSATNVAIYADTLTAAIEFPELAGQQELCPKIDTEADPLAAYHSRDRQ